jgi:hypothetical protein
MNKVFPLNPFNNVLAAGVANCDLNNLLGNTLEAIDLTLGGTFTKSMMTLIQLKANGKVVFETTGAALDALEQFKSYPADATHLSINFMDTKARTLNGFQAGAMDLGPQSGITSLRLEVTISGATAPTLAGLAELSPSIAVASEQGIRWLISRRHRAIQTIAAANTYALQVPHIDPVGGGSVFRRIAIYSANLTYLKAQRNGVFDFDHSVADLQFLQKKAGRTPQANLTVFDPTLDNISAQRVWDTTPGAKCTQAILYGTFSAGETITIETEELIPLAMY